MNWINPFLRLDLIQPQLGKQTSFAEAMAGKRAGQVKKQISSSSQPVNSERQNSFASIARQVSVWNVILVVVISMFATRPAIVIGVEEKEEASLIIIDVSEVPGLKQWAENAKDLLVEWHPKITTLLIGEDREFTPPKKVTLFFKNEKKGIAHARGTMITIMSGWVEKHPDDIGLTVHELVHVIQGYPDGAPGWVTEGIADYIRWAIYEKKHQEWFPRPDSARENGYLKSYQTSAGFFLWLESGRFPSIIQKLNKSVRSGNYNDGFFKKETGDSLTELWRMYFESNR